MGQTVPVPEHGHGPPTGRQTRQHLGERVERIGRVRLRRGAGVLGVLGVPETGDQPWPASQEAPYQCPSHVELRVVARESAPRVDLRHRGSRASVRVGGVPREQTGRAREPGPVLPGAGGEVVVHGQSSATMRATPSGSALRGACASMYATYATCVAYVTYVTCTHDRGSRVARDFREQRQGVWRGV